MQGRSILSRDRTQVYIQAKTFKEFLSYDVLVLSRSDFVQVITYQGFNATDAVKQIDKLLRDKLSTLRHEIAEADATYKQLVSHIVVRTGEEFLVVQRDSGEKSAPELQGRLVLGVEGHVLANHFSKEDIGIWDNIRSSTIYKLDDELDTTALDYSSCNLTLIGIVNDESNLISIKHFGLVYLLDTTKKLFPRTEMTLVSGFYVTLDQIERYLPRFDNWSRHIYHYLSKGHFS